MTTTTTDTTIENSIPEQYYELLVDFSGPFGGVKSLEMRRAWEVSKTFMRNGKHEYHQIETLVAVAGIIGIMSTKYEGLASADFNRLLDETCGEAADWLEGYLNPEDFAPQELREAFMEETGANAAMMTLLAVAEQTASNVIELRPQH